MLGVRDDPARADVIPSVVGQRVDGDRDGKDQDDQ